MQEFRPASVIDADTALAASFRDGDEHAIRSLVDRYGGGVTGLAVWLIGDGPSTSQRAKGVAVEVFLQAWRNSEHFEPGRDFAPWLASITTRAVAALDERTTDGVTPSDDDEIARVWTVTSATSHLSSDAHETLRSFYVDGIEPADEAGVARDQVRLERRLEHLAAVGEGAGLLGDPRAWIRPDPDLSDRVLAAVRSEIDRGPRSDEEFEDVPPAGRRPARTRRSGSSRSAVIGVAAALAVLLGAIIVLSALSGAPEQEDLRAELVPTGLLADVDGGEIVVTERDSGLQIDLDAPSLPRRAGGPYYLAQLLLVDGSSVAVGTFNEGSDVTLWGGIPLDRAVSFRVVLAEADDGDGGSADDGGSDAVVLKVDLPRR